MKILLIKKLIHAFQLVGRYIGENEQLIITRHFRKNREIISTLSNIRYSFSGKEGYIENKPIWPMNAVSTREARGSAAKASVAGSAICAISRPNSSFLKIFLPNPLWIIH